MITTEVMGGLGNQLFQIFNLIAYSLTYKIPFFFEAKKISRLDRPFYWSNFLLSLRPFLRIAYDSKIPQYRESHFHYNLTKSLNLLNFLDIFNLINIFKNIRNLFISILN